MNWKKLLIGTWSWKRPFYSLGSIYLLLALYAYFLANQLIFQPPGTPYPDDQSHFTIIPAEEETIATYHRPASPGMPTLLWSHGNAQNLGSLTSVLDDLHNHGYGVLSYDYPGYGLSSGKPTEKSCYHAIETTYQHALSTLKIEPSHLILIGQSVGSGPTTWLAAKHEHHSVALIAPFLSAYRTVTHIPLFPGDRFPNHKNITRVSSPLLVIHGEDDQVIPFKHGKRLFELSPSQEKTFLPIPAAGHNNLFHNPSFDLPTLIQNHLWKKSPLTSISP